MTERKLEKRSHREMDPESSGEEEDEVANDLEDMGESEGGYDEHEDEDGITESENDELDHEDDAPSYKKPRTNRKEISYGIPPAIIKNPSELSMIDSKNELNDDKMDIVNTTIMKTSDTFMFSNTPFLMCSPAGLKWMGEKMGDPTMVKLATKSIGNALMSSFAQSRISVKESETPATFTPEVLRICATAFKSYIRFYGIISDEEVDTIVNNEINKPTNASNANGLAEKLVIHCILAIGLLCLRDLAHSHLYEPPFEINMSIIFRQVNSAQYYFFKFILIGNSLMGIKGVCLLTICLTFSFNTCFAIMISGVGVRLAQLSGLHMKQYSEKLPSLEAERVHRLWWIIYVLEKSVSMESGKPSVILEESISTPLPKYHPELDGVNNRDKFCIARSQAQLYQIWPKISSVLYAVTPNRPAREKLTALVQIDQELEKWINQTPFQHNPNHIRDYIKNLTHLSAIDQFHLTFHVTSTCILYHFMKTTIFRFVAYHPSWIFKVATTKDKNSGDSTDLNSNESEADASPCTTHDHFMSKLIANRKKAMSKPDQRTWVEKYNGVKLLTKQIATDNPILLNSFETALDHGRQAVQVAHNLRGSKTLIFSLGIFVLNGFITILIKCMIQPTEAQTDNDLKILDEAVDLIKNTVVISDLLQQDFDLLDILKASVTKYVRKAQQNVALEHNPCTSPINVVPTMPTGTSAAVSASPSLMNVPTAPVPPVNYMPEFIPPHPPHDAGYAETPEYLPPRNQMTFEDILMQPTFPDDPNFFDSLYQLSNIWGNWEAIADPAQPGLNGTLQNGLDGNIPQL